MDKMTIEEYQKLFEKCLQKDASEEATSILCLLYVSLISSDTILCIEDCERSTEELLKMLKGLEYADIDEEKRASWIDMVKNGLDICDRDRDLFRERSTPEYIEKEERERELERQRMEKIRLTDEDLTWFPIYPNNMSCNGVDGVYTLLFRKDYDGTLRATKWSIGFQKEECAPGIIAGDSEIELYILHRKDYANIKGAFNYPDPNAYHDLFADTEDTFHNLDINDYGDFVRAYKTLEEAKQGALCKSGWCGYNKETIITNLNE